ncbi:MAG: tail fiber domain-containing protein [Chloroflexota bacterium]
MAHNRYTKLLFVFLILLLSVLACNLPEERSPTPTVYLQETSSSPEEETNQAPGPDQSQAATDTPTPSLTPTITLTSTPKVPKASVSINTNCRAGPGKNYKKLGVVTVGEKTEIVGIGSTGHYYIVVNPDNPSGVCWLWDKYVTVHGNTSQLPQMTPPPSPTPEPTISYQIDPERLITCGSLDLMVYWIGNDGELPLESVEVTIENLSTSTTIFGPGHTDAPFTPNVTSCPPGFDTLGPGGAAYLAVIVDPPPSSNQTIQATVKMCAQNGLGEPCLTKEVSWVAPSMFSDRNRKTGITPITPQDVLDKVASLPISTWSYTFEESDIRHIGPMAQDFYSLFQVGEDETHIHTIDAFGVSLASIQALNEQMEEMESRLTELEHRTSSPLVPWLSPLLALSAGLFFGAVGHRWWMRRRREH